MWSETGDLRCQKAGLKGMVLAGVVAIIFHQISHEARPSRMVSRRIGLSPVGLGIRGRMLGDSAYMEILTSARLESMQSDMTGGANAPIMQAWIQK